MYVLTSRKGYITDIDDRGDVKSSVNLDNAIKYSSYESVKEDSLLTGCEIIRIDSFGRPVNSNTLFNK